MRFIFWIISMEKQKRQAKWAECKWCKARGLCIVFRSGKRKCLEKHMVMCKNDYLLESEVASRTDSHDLVRTVALLSQQVAELQAQMRVLMLKRDRYYIERDNFWNKLTPKLAWKRHTNCVFEQLQATKMVQKSLGMAFRLLCVAKDWFTRCFVIWIMACARIARKPHGSARNRQYGSLPHV